jgi:hypothetical protein
MILLGVLRSGRKARENLYDQFLCFRSRIRASHVIVGVGAVVISGAVSA